MDHGTDFIQSSPNFMVCLSVNAFRGDHRGVMLGQTEDSEREGSGQRPKRRPDTSPTTGAYFAETSCLADKYAPAGPDGLHAILLVRAALGRVYVETRRESQSTHM